MGGCGLTWGRAGGIRLLGDRYSSKKNVQKSRKTKAYFRKLQAILHVKVWCRREKMIGNEAEKVYWGQTMKCLIHHAKKFDL